MKKLFDKLQKHERSIAAVVFLIGIIMIAFYIYSAVIYINSETEVLEQKLSAISIEGNGEVFTADYSLDIQKDEKTNKEYLASFDIDSITQIKQEDGKYIIVSNTGNKYDQTDFLDDEGNRITAHVKDGKLWFENIAGEKIDEFKVNTHSVSLKDNVLVVDSYKLSVPSGAVKTTTKKTTSKTTTTTISQTPKKTTSKAPEKTTSKTNPVVKQTQQTQPQTIKTTTTTTTTTTKATTTTFAPYTPSGDAAEVLRLVNIERSNHGLKPLKAIYLLDQASLVRAKEITSLQAHQRPDGRSVSSVLSDYGLSFRYMGENLACGSQTPQEVVKDWMNSVDHRANILNPNYEYMGLGHVYLSEDSNYYYDYWIQLFYTPL